MLDDLLSFLRFVTDPETRKTIAEVSSVVAKKQKNWRKEIKTANATFHSDEPDRIGSFVGFLCEEARLAGVSPDQIRAFRIVFDELITNALTHGCQSSSKCRVSVRCTYSRWFIRLEISDTGKGFDLEHTIQQQEDSYRLNRQKFRHGLQLVKSLTYRLRTNRKGNVITAFLSGQDRITLLPVIETYKNTEIYTITIKSISDWYYIKSGWEPLRRLVENADQKLILIDCQVVTWSTNRLREIDEVADSFRASADRYYAFVVEHSQAEYFELSRLSSDNLRVFHGDELRLAKDWLLACSRQPAPKTIEVLCIHCSKPNRASAHFCKWCGARLNH